MPDQSVMYLPPKVQAILPALKELSIQERFSLIHFLTSDDVVDSPKKPAPLDIRLFDKVQMTEDFDEYLGDDFWLSDDDILCKHQK